MATEAVAAPSPVPAGPAVAAPKDAPVAVPENRQPAAEPKPAPKTFKLKTAKGEREVSEDELVTLASMNAAERDHLEVTQAEAKKAQDFMRRLKENPKSALADPSVGHDIKKLAIDWLKEAMEEERLTPEQRRLRELEAKLKAKEDAEAETQKQAEAKKQEAFIQQQREHYVKLVTDAMGETGLPKSGPAADRAAQRIVQFLQIQISKGHEPNAKMAARAVEMEYEEEHKALYGATDPKVLLKKFPGLADALRKAALEEAQLVKPGAPATNPAAPVPTREQPRAKNVSDYQEAKARIDARARGR